MDTEELHIHANGKLLLAGEYFVLDGATALAIPTRFGQDFEISVIPGGRNKINWQSIDSKGFPWYRSTISMDDFSVKDSSSSRFDERVIQILKAAEDLGGEIPDGTIFLKSILDFPRDWGLGTSSTLIYAAAEWLKVNPFQLLKKTFGGSGYDIACANSDSAIFFNIKNDLPDWQTVLFDPPFKENIGFLYLGEKQNSRAGINQYREKGLPPAAMLAEISHLAKAMTHQDDLTGFIEVIEKLEKITSEWIGTPTIKSLFPDFDGGIKSLGAWGGDFVMAVSPQGTDYMKAFFSGKGKQFQEIFYWRNLGVFLTYEEMVATQ